MKVSRQNSRSDSPTAKAFISMSASFTRPKKFTLTVGKIPCGNSFLYRHNNGHPLASKEILKPLVMPLDKTRFFTPDIVEQVVDVGYKMREVSVSPGQQPQKSARNSVRKSVRKGDGKRSGTGRITLDNNYFTLSKDATTVFEACWINLYAVYNGFQFGSNEMLLIFYKTHESAEEDNHKSTLSLSVTEFVLVKLSIKFKDVTLDNLLELVHSAVRGQASYLLNAAKLLANSNETLAISNADAFFRAFVDLKAISCNEVSDKVNAIEEFLTYLEKFKVEENPEEIEFWKRRVKELLREDSDTESLVDGSGVTM